MIKSKSRNTQKEMLNSEMLKEHAELSRIAPTFGRTAPEGYAERAKAFNAECKKLGATMMMVVES